jgi:hypothetical protein
MKNVSVTIMVYDWNGKEMTDGSGFAQFKSATMPDVTARGTVKDGTVSFGGVSLMPAGTLFFQVTRSSGAPLSGLQSYKLNGEAMIFTANQGKRTGRQGGGSGTEAAKNFGVEGTLGKDFEAVKAEVKVAAGIEDKKSTEEHTEWDITAGTDALEIHQTS